MGVPKFYRWISERYTKINEIVSDSALLPEFDHLYLDMNGIIHGCTHPSHLDVSDVISERDMMLGIMHYLDRIITQIVKPKVSVYMAIDGVAPRAKLNQQRSRRFRSAKDMAEATKDMPRETDERGNAKQPNVFDSNCITPGTEFLAKVSATIKYFIRKKIKEDPSWRNLKVIFSGHEIPGEGEHKIMEHIRMMRNQTGYRPNTRHCIYGQDADLIMLGLVTHEPHFTILREVVDFSSGFRNQNALKQVKKFTKESDFQLLHLSVLREYLKIEFCTDYAAADVERVIDDFVFMTFLVGNDFLPHLNSLDIGEGAFDLLFQIYKEQRPGWGGGNYLTESGELSDPARLEAFLVAIGSVEQDTLEQREVNDAEFLKKKRKWNKRDGLPSLPSDSELKATEDAKQNDYSSMVARVVSENPNATFVDGWNPKLGEKDYKGRYYYEKLKLTPLDIEKHHALRQSYIEGLIWCLAYYYRGCISWGWFYPYHYGPMLSDLINLPAMFENITFQVGKPILPFQQLMSCLPPGSSQLVPKPYQFLMTNPESPILEFYPVDFEVDMNGKKNPWEGVNLLPFIEIDRLLAAIKKYCPDEKLTDTERARNTRGNIYCYTFDLTCTGTIESPNRGIGLIDIPSCNSLETILPEYKSEGVSFKPELLPGTQIPYPGFPSLNVIPIATTELVPISVDVFGMKSKYPTMVLKLHEMPALPPVEALAGNVLGKSLFINWPMMHEARVIAISDEKTEVRLHKGKHKVNKLDKVETERWLSDSEAMVQSYFAGRGIPGSGGVQIGDIRVRIKLLPLQGMKTNRNTGSTKKLFGNEEADVPLQLALWQAPAPDPRFMEKGPMKLNDRFPATSNVVLTKGKYRGCLGIVVGSADEKTIGVKVKTTPAEIPFGLAIARSVYESYISSSDAARILKIHPGLFGKITGILMFEPGKYDLGLNLKSSEGLCVAGFTRQKKEKARSVKDEKKAWDSGDSVLVIGSERTVADGNERSEERIVWEYTPKAIRLVNEYRQKFPQLFAALVRMPNEKKYDATKVFGPNGADWLPVVREWLNSVESSKLPRTPISTDTMSKEAVLAVEKAASVRNLAMQKKGYPKESLIKIPGSALYRENSTSATDVILASDYNDNEAPELGDRVVNLCASGIPFGARGTVVGIHQATTGCVEVVMDEEFVGGTNLQGLCSNFRGKLCVWAHLMRITVDNYNTVVDKMVPNGSGKAAIDKILNDIMQQSSASVAATAPSPNSLPQPDLEPSKTAAAVARTPSAPRSASVQNGTRAESSGKPRASSAGRDKQAGWMQARGPPEKGIGFKSAKKPKGGGLTRWKHLINGKSVTAKKQGAADLKKILGVGKLSIQPSSVSEEKELKVMLGVGGKTAGVEQPSKQLKAMLGVGNKAIPSAPPASGQGASAGLKAMLGVGVNQTPIPPAPTQSHPSNSFPSPASAADKLLQLMAKQQPQTMPPPMAMQTTSSFNFTYVEEGKDAPEAPTPISPGSFLPPPTMPMMAPAYGHVQPMNHMPVPHFGMPGVGMMPPVNMLPPQPPVQPASAVISEDEFPPLGGGATRIKAEPTTVPVSKQSVATPVKLVPSNVKAS